LRNLKWVGTIIAAAFATVAFADDRKDTVGGSLVLGEKTYKFQHVVAYETKKSNKKRTVVMITVKEPKLDKLKESLKEKGDDSGYFLFDDNLKLVFDEKGELLQMVVYADPGKNINLIGDDNIKAEATFKDGVVKGKAKTVKPDKAFGEMYSFEVEFDVKLMKP
jgi:Zn-dependent M28 family amino/carboxypeptidase